MITPEIESLYRKMASLPVREVREEIRSGHFTNQTGGLAPGKLQGNLAILPAEYALEFATYCQRNPKPCPLIGMSDVGNPKMTTLGADIDIRTDVPQYRVYEDGELVDEVSDITSLWRDDLVAFVLGCSYSFEEALARAGIPLRHLETRTTPSVYETSIETVPAGRFRGPLVVSMRPFAPHDVSRVIEISGRFPLAHGAPVHVGDPGQIGIKDFENPEWGGRTKVQKGEISLYWACGVTPQAAVRFARPKFCITHSPGCMLITDLNA